ncbi:unnamed protein product [Miscanthus lutarioriparius]|uniref:Uncharacterized protein n=1 Tax=Miscanthus lutarioriparius TaxID=422564 RepID=A0A811SEV8_9POAL|nr:unnamed protein product [Miscanthus lutarioriparius]
MYFKSTSPSSSSTSPPSSPRFLDPPRSRSHLKYALQYLTAVLTEISSVLPDLAGIVGRCRPGEFRAQLKGVSR